MMGNGGLNFDRSKTALDIGGAAFSGLEKMVLPGSNNYFMGKNGKYYNLRPNGKTGSRIGAIQAAKMYRVAGTVVTVVSGGIEIGMGVYEDSQLNGGKLTYGYNAQKATASAVGGGVGGWAGAGAGAEGGAIVGSAICPGLGTAIGAAVGAIGGGFFGSSLGSGIGKAVFDYFY
ncbi:MAG: hypothetical protein BGN96_16475 [Bacteroidales bacterium 45-6]|nr:MAG: hypothetical protein BGN96_16475 [Bacteroidales bacterium 45-6]